jgi:hypothetical protein
MARKLIRVAIVIAGLLAAYVAGALSVVVFVLLMPTNARDNADPSMRPEMVRVTVEWGRLAPFPATARDFVIKTEGNMFTRSFRGSFTDTPEHIEAWLATSPGVSRAYCTQTSMGETCRLQTSERVSYGEVVVSPDKSRVTFYVAWS